MYCISRSGKPPRGGSFSCHLQVVLPACNLRNLLCYLSTRIITEQVGHMINSR